MKSNFAKFAAGFGYAVQGIAYCIKTQRNFRFHICAGVIVMLMSLFYDFGRAEYAVLFVTISSVITAEAVNSAVEKAVDLCTDKINPTAKIAKDAAAGAVLITAVFAVGVGVCLFGDIAVLKKIFALAAVYPLADVGAAAMIVMMLVWIFSK